MTTDRRPIAQPWLNRTVVGAGIASAFGDFCYETTTVILPGFLAVLGIPAAALGIIEGIADAVAAFTKLVSGYIADKLGHRKLLVLAGYGLTPIGQALLALAVGWPLLLLGRVVSWFGKGLRGPLRDAIVMQAVSPQTRGRAFGFHRAADTVGAVLGPLLGVALLGWARGLHWGGEAGPFRWVLWWSVIPGTLAVLAFLALVKDPEYSPNPALKFFGSLRGLPSRFKRYLGAVGIFGLGDFSHSLLILAATTLLAPSLGVIRAAQVAGLLYVWRNVVQVATDRRGGGPDWPLAGVDRGLRARCPYGGADGTRVLVGPRQLALAGRDLLRRRLVCRRPGGPGAHRHGRAGARGHVGDELWRTGHGQRHGEVHFQRDGRHGMDRGLADAWFRLGCAVDGSRDTGFASRRGRLADRDPSS